MKYFGMPSVMWMLYERSFRDHLTSDLGYGVQSAGRIMKKAKPGYRKIIEKLPEFEKEDRFKTNIINCALLISILQSLDKRPTTEELTEYYEAAMTNTATKIFCRKGGKIKFSEKDTEGMKATAALKAADRNPYSWNMDYLPYDDGSGYEARFYKCGICTLMKEYGFFDLVPAMCHLDYTMSKLGGASVFVREYTLASGGPYCDCGYKKKGEKQILTETEKKQIKKKTIKTMKGKRTFKAEIDRRVSSTESDKIWRDAHKRLYRMYTGHRDLSKGISKHTDSFTFPAAAIYLAIKVVDPDMAYEIMKKIMAERSGKMGRMLSVCCRIPGFKSFFLGMWDAVSRKMFGSASGFKNVFYPKEKGCFRMDITQCPYNKYLTEQGCPELNILFCENDVHSYGNLPGLKFTRTKTIGAGDDVCDFKMELVKKR